MIYGTIATVDLLLMLRYSRKELPPPAPRLLLAYQAWTYYVLRRRVTATGPGQNRRTPDAQPTS